MATKYHCENPACSLGTVGNPGRFTDGMTKEALNVLTGQPVDDMEEGVHFGEGFCPNCGTAGTEYDDAAAQKDALADAKAAYDAQVAAIKGEVA